MIIKKDTETKIFNCLNIKANGSASQINWDCLFLEDQHQVGAADRRWRSANFQYAIRPSYTNPWVTQ